MKKSFFFILLSCFILLGYSCSSDDNNVVGTQSENELREVSFNISNFSSETSEISTRSSLADNKIKYLRYVVFNRDPAHPEIEGEVVESNTLEGSDLGSVFKLKIKKGSYRIAIFASELPIRSEKVNPNGGSLGSSEPIEATIIEDITNPNKFHGSIDFEVSNTDIQETVKLKRSVGKITLAISDLDKAPSDVQTIIPILCVTDKNAPQPYAMYFQPSYNLMYNGASVFSGVDPDHSHLYSSIYIDRSKFSSINEENPFSFYMLQNININYSVVGMYPSAPLSYDLYLQGSRTNKIERQYLINPTRPGEDVKNTDVVFMIRIKEGIVINPNEQITIKGLLFKNNQGFDITVDHEWGNNTNEIIDQLL
ncbi:hypothetical protein [Dysgonomonas sp. HGC4]|uniref:hypothetical protein n=1 Tax=Dysgonomonas sp. HGC4 TaxID=1658009 RepID=UPI000682905E|nr:hypothetical protein [Dysgonomonas sp. HGC4]MBD8349716.1 hypothetical protein [Dysgonomonas sp. HGC4]